MASLRIVASLCFFTSSVPYNVYAMQLMFDVRKAQLNSTSGFSYPFESFVKLFQRDYEEGSEEHCLRSNVFDTRMELIEKHNSKADRTWTAGVTSLTDRTDDELAQLRGWRRVGRAHVHGGGTSLLAESSKMNKKLPEKMDWLHLGMATDVPDQGACGSCWAMATASMLQGRYEVAFNKSMAFSAQQLVDCVPNPDECGGTGGCEGATVEVAMEYVAEMGLRQLVEVPYIGRQMKCTRLPSSKSSFYPKSIASFVKRWSKHWNHPVAAQLGGRAIGLSGWKTLPENQALPLMHALVKGPVAISVAAGDWWLYSNGIFDSCPKDVIIDHAVVLVGYGVETDSDSNRGDLKYWRIRNSWGDGWGERGYIRLLRQDSPEKDEKYCGTDFDPKLGVACKPYPKKVRVCGMCGMLYDSVIADFAADLES